MAETPERQAESRDRRLAVTTPDVELLRSFEPVIRYTQGEQFFPMDVVRYVQILQPLGALSQRARRSAGQAGRPDDGQPGGAAAGRLWNRALPAVH